VVDGDRRRVGKVGERSLHGMLLLESLGYQHAKSLRGGLKAWVEAGLPTEG
jgi:rhodanese-related sulfurtransferase